MEFGIFAQLFVPRYERDVDPMAEHKRIMRNIEVGIAADRTGIKYVWCPEHHFLDEYSHMPGPEVYLSYVAGRTERIHVGSAIFNITPKVNHPARVAETVALMDHITEGRFEFGTGRGSSTTEVYGFDIDDLGETTAMWDEAVREIPKMWKEGEYAYEGQYFRMPPREVFPKPYGAAHPPMWVAAGSPPTFAKAGSMGLGAFCFTHGAPKSIAPLIGAYKEAIATAEPVGDFVNDNLMVVTNMICMEDREQAFEAAVTSGMNYYTSLQMHWLDNIPKPEGFPVWPDLIPEPTIDQLKKAVELGMVVVGDPDDCAKAVQRWVDIGADQICFSPTTNNMHQDQIIESMELFGREVIPQFDTDPVHRTTRMRDAAVAAPSKVG
jgi:alkanesulfonate monooxygenase SsuD/methylene tetrahydromethanopterin reductase-like flavin-dependent oxidoreductase (luciferase family)